MSSQRLYHAPLPIGPARHHADQIRDAEAFCRRYLDQAFEEWGHFERPDDYDDSLAILIVHLWRLAETFDAERNDCFAAYARSIIPKRAVDVGPRRLLGRNGAKLPGYLADTLDESAAAGRPREALATLPSGPDPDRQPDDRRLQAQRDRSRAWAAGVLGVRAA